MDKNTVIIITSKKSGFWRAGIQHQDEPVKYIYKDFTKEQWALLEAEPMLIISYPKPD